ncbi:hypothetical protein M4I21_04940 [Cellulophaga sp. 20_2_10]|uniref:hypothetical protein n=1 Tax=Cellulophaga sp. 20_2_10 TaxID=2942476 RepID=UPI00201B2224|nr:hypothetical protein [Cellulophaga sp. 20_2_10]MCL5245143.1 hypothetical protein [Cellulophaga sp. 20_2_10]
MRKDTKQGEENMKLVKDKNEKTRNYLFQKNKITVLAFIIVLVILIALLVSVFATSSQI